MVAWRAVEEVLGAALATLARGCGESDGYGRIPASSLRQVECLHRALCASACPRVTLGEWWGDGVSLVRLDLGT